MESVVALKPEFLFSFYYRFMLPIAVLRAPARGAFNMHGSLLPKYRGRVPINWAIIHGECETGATLHEIVTKPDAGPLVDQQAVPILPNDTALDVFRKATVAAEMVLHRSLPKLISGTAQMMPQDLAAGSYFGGRKPEDGRVNWTSSARQVHNLIRAVAPPYPGAFCDLNGKRLRLLGSFLTGQSKPATTGATLYASDDTLYVQCADGGVLRLLAAEINGQTLSAQNINTLLGASQLALTNPADNATELNGAQT